MEVHIMTHSPAKKAIVVGFDGASMELVAHMVEQGYMPNVGKLMAQGVYREMLGVFPTLTPPGSTRRRGASTPRSAGPSTCGTPQSAAARPRS
jgi:hypothetical protein